MKVGDIVKIKENYEFFVNSMKEYRGKQAKITRVSGESYKLDIDDGRWNWTDSMFEHKEEIKMKFRIGDYVKIKEGLNHENAPNFIDDMKKYCGKKAKVVDIIKPYYKLDIDKEEWYWDEETLEKFQGEYHIIVDGNTIIMRDNNGNESESDIDTSISIAISRLKWKPSLDEKYYSISFANKYNSVGIYTWANDSTDNTLYERGLIFRTEEEAEEAAKIVLDSIKEK